MVKAFFIDEIAISSVMSRTKSERITNISVIIIALAAVFISIWQGYVTQKHNRLTVRPYFDLTPATRSTNSGQEFYLQLTNQGYGLGIIKAFEISVDGQQVPNWNAALNKLGIEGQMRQASNFKPKDVFAAGKEQDLVTIGDYVGEGRINLRIVYQSIYEERFEEEITF